MEQHDYASIIRRTIHAFDAYFPPEKRQGGSDPGLDRFASDLRRLLALAEQLKASRETGVSPEDAELLRELGGKDAAPWGPLTGLSVKDVADNVLGHLLIQTEKEAERMARQVGVW